MAISVDYKSTPLTYADLAAPFEQIKEVYDQTQEAYDKVDQTVSTLESQIREGDTRAMQQYKAYMARFDPAIESFSHGMNVVNMSALTGLRHDMYKEITPIATAAARRASLEDEQRKALSTNPELIYERRASDMSLDTFMDDPLADYGRTINGETVYNRARDAFDHISKAFGDAKINYQEAPNGALMAEVSKETGLNAEQLNNLYKAYESGNLSTSDLEQLVVAQTAQNLFNQTGVQNWGNPSAELQVRNKIISALEYTLGTRDVTVQNLGGGSGGGTRGGGGTSTTGGGHLGNTVNFYTQLHTDRDPVEKARSYYSIYAKVLKKYDDATDETEKEKYKASLDALWNDLGMESMFGKEIGNAKDVHARSVGAQNAQLEGLSNQEYFNKSVRGNDPGGRFHSAGDNGWSDTIAAMDTDDMISSLLGADHTTMSNPDTLKSKAFIYKLDDSQRDQIFADAMESSQTPLGRFNLSGGQMKWYRSNVKKDDLKDDNGKYSKVHVGNVYIAPDGHSYLRVEVAGENEPYWVDLNITNIAQTRFNDVSKIMSFLPLLQESIKENELTQQLKDFVRQMGEYNHNLNAESFINYWGSYSTEAKKEFLEDLIDQMYLIVGESFVSYKSKPTQVENGDASGW